MIHFRNQWMVLLCMILGFGLNGQQNLTEISFSVATKPLTPVAQQVAYAKSSGVTFQQTEPLKISSRQETIYKTSLDNKYKVLDADVTALGKLVQQKPDHLSLTIPLNEREKVTLELVRVDLYAEGFQVFTSDQQKTPQDYNGGAFYRGVVSGHENESVAAISIFDEQVIGSFTTGQGNMVIQPLYEDRGQLILFNDLDIQEPFNFHCYSDELEPVQKPVQPRGITAAGDCIRVYIECDYALFQNKGGTTNTVNWITAVFNNVKTLYTNESINTTLSEVFVWTSPDNYSKTSSYTALTQFRSARPSFNGDLAHLAALGGQNIGGVAWVDVLCTSYKYAYSNISSTYQNVPTYSWTIEVMSHEMGHNVGSNHTHWCGWAGGAIDNCYTPEGNCSRGPAPTNGGTIMSYCHLTTYGINFNNGFGPKPGDKIRAEVVAATCLGRSCSGGSCGTPTGLAISNITQNSATASWNAVSGATSYSFEYKLSTSTNWTVASTTTPSYNMTGLTGNSTYNTRVKANCSGGSSAYSGTVNFTTSGGGGCDIPSGLAISNITQNSATASWNAVSGATSYSFEYKLSTSGTWTVASTTTPSYNMTGLTGNSTYNTRVKANCSGGSSAYSNTVNFTTSGGTSCGTPTNFIVFNITNNSATSTWSPVQGALSYNFQYKLASSGTWNQANVTSTGVNLTNLTPSTSYTIRVQAVCSGGTSGFTNILTFTTSAGGYCTSRGNSSRYEWIRRVNLGTIDRTSGADGGYFNATNLVTDVSKGGTYTINHQAGSSGGSGTLYWKVWIDYNNNYSFTDAGEEVVSVASSSLNLLSKTFTVPAGAATATVRMRVSVKYGGYPTSCQTFAYGEVEDYSVNIKAAGTLVGPGSNQIEGLSLYPNPFTDQFVLDFNASGNQEVRVSVVDPVGKILFVQHFKTQEGRNIIPVETGNLSPSQYLIKIESDQEHHIRKLIKLE